MKDSILYYSVGPLLYCPANHKSLANSLIHERFGRHFSLAVCLEDTIRDDRIAEAEHELVQTIHTLFNEKKKQKGIIKCKNISLHIDKNKEKRKIVEVKKKKKI